MAKNNRRCATAGFGGLDEGEGMSVPKRRELLFLCFFSQWQTGLVSFFFQNVSAFWLNRMKTGLYNLLRQLTEQVGPN